MLLDLTRYRQPTAQFSRSFEPAELAQDGDAYTVLTPVLLAFELRKDKDRFRLVGRVEARLQLACSRCAEGYPLDVRSEFDLRYWPVREAENEPDAEIGEDELETSYYRDDQIDLDELIREQFYLALPMKPLCDTACRGLCPHCGTNLNTGACGCAPKPEDPRLSALRALQGRQET
jgi:uncharacterized protein